MSVFMESSLERVRGAAHMIGRTMPDLHHREAGTPGDPAVLLVHGYPESSYMWRDVLPSLAAAGFHAVAPDLAGFGDSEPDPPGIWERHVEALERFREQRGLGAVALVVHDWGGLIGLRWACDRPGAVWALCISSTGFFPDGKWRGPGEVLRTEGQGEAFVDGLDRDGLAGLLSSVSSGIGPDAVDEYFKAFADEPRRRAQLELYRSGDFKKLEPYEGRLAALGVPALLLWGEDDFAAPVAGARGFGGGAPRSGVGGPAGTGGFVVGERADRRAAAAGRRLHARRPAGA